MNDLTWDNLYTSHTAEYELLVTHEDCQHNLLSAIQGLLPIDGKVVVEFGAGTGRLTELLAGHVRELYAFDYTHAMLRQAQVRQRRQGWRNVSLTLADSRRMPLGPCSADLAIEGWAFLQIAVWHPQAWQAQLDRALDEMYRVLCPGGKMILIETLGTGESAPRVVPFFREVYDYLESGRGFTPLAIRTDYRFETLQQVRQVVLPLFGDEMLERLVSTPAGWILPECTGLWWQ